MIEPRSRGRRIATLKDSPNWIPFYDDGRIVMFGRTDAPAADLAVFKANRLEPARSVSRDQSAAALRGPADADLVDRRRLPEPDAGPAADADAIGVAMADGGAGTHRRPADAPRAGALPAGDPGRPHRAVAQPRRLDGLPHPQRGLSPADHAGDRPDGRHPADAREPGPDQHDHAARPTG